MRQNNVNETAPNVDKLTVQTLYAYSISRRALNTRSFLVVINIRSIVTQNKNMKNRDFGDIRPDLFVFLVLDSVNSHSSGFF